MGMFRKPFEIINFTYFRTLFICLLFHSTAELFYYDIFFFSHQHAHTLFHFKMSSRTLTIMALASAPIAALAAPRACKAGTDPEVFAAAEPSTAPATAPSPLPSPSSTSL